MSELEEEAITSSGLVEEDLTMSGKESEAVWSVSVEGEILLFGLESEDLAVSGEEWELVTWSGVE